MNNKQQTLHPWSPEDPKVKGLESSLLFHTLVDCLSRIFAVKKLVIENNGKLLYVIFCLTTNQCMVKEINTIKTVRQSANYDYTQYNFESVKIALRPVAGPS